MKPVPHRLELIEGANGTAIIDDSYNANISGVRGALEVLSCFEGKRYVVTQGIVELGREQFEVNFGLGKELAAVSDAIVTLGQNCKAFESGGAARQTLRRKYCLPTPSGKLRLSLLPVCVRAT